MMLDWKALIQGVKMRGDEMATLSPETRNGYRTLHSAGAQTNHLDEKARELIALAVAITTRSDACIANHTEKAIRLGVPREHIMEALSVAVAMNTGAAMAYPARVMDAYAAIAGEGQISCADAEPCRGA